MADDVSIELWMERRRLSALDKQLEQSGYCGDVEKYMQECLIALYAETVPTEVQAAIEQEITTERLDAQHRAEESRRISVFHVTEHGADVYFKTERSYELLQAVNQLRAYLRKAQDALPNTFGEYFLNAQRSQPMILISQLPSAWRIPARYPARSILASISVNFSLSTLWTAGKPM